MSSSSGTGPGHRWGLLHAAGLCLAKAMRLVPRRRRFGAAMLISRAAVPFLRRTEAHREQLKSNIDGKHEVALHLILDAMTKNGTVFDPVIAVKGYEELERAASAGKGVLVLTPHAVLSMLLFRVFHDGGLDLVGITADPLMRVSGTRLTARTLQPSPNFLVATRSSLRGGRVVCAMPDRGEHQQGRTVEFATANGRLIVADALMRVAARCEARVLFMEAHMEHGGVVGTIVAPPSSSSCDAEAITSDFIKFVRALAEARSEPYS